jgi:hypothetical protein
LGDSAAHSTSADDAYCFNVHTFSSFSIFNKCQMNLN